MAGEAITAVYRTLAYYQALSELPLTILEIQRYNMQKEGDKKIPLFDIQQALSRLEQEGWVMESHGLWALYGCNRALQKRLIGLQQTPMKWKVAKKNLWFLPLIPFVEKITITGSVALAHADDESDIDVLLHTRRGALWTVRFLATISAFMIGVRRHGKRIKNRLCFNHFSNITVETLGPVNVHAVVSRIGIEVWQPGKSKRYMSLFAPSVSPFLLQIKRDVEFFLRTSRLDKVIEKLLGNGQIRKIQDNPLGYPQELEKPSLTTQNLIFYYPKVRETEERYKHILAHAPITNSDY